MSKTKFLTQSNLPSLKEMEGKIKLATRKDMKDIKQTKRNEGDLMKYKILEREINMLKRDYTMHYKKVVGLLKKEVGHKPPIKGRFFSWNDVKNNRLSTPGNISWQECKKRCDENTECSAWERCNPGRGSLDVTYLKIIIQSQKRNVIKNYMLKQNQNGETKKEITAIIL